MSAGTWSEQDRDPAVTGRTTGAFDVLAERAAATGVAVLVIIGFVSSYTTVRDLAVDIGQFPTWLAPVVPLSFDVGIVVLSLRVLIAARAGRTARVLRALVLGLAVATVLLNGIASDSLAGRLLHAVPSAMFVVCFETVVESARRRSLGDPPAADTRFRAARWLMAPLQTWKTLRDHILNDTSSESTDRPEKTPPIPTAFAIKERVQPSRTSTREHRPSRARSATDKRLQAARVIVSEQPDITASGLAELLTNHGPPVSTRTANRIRDEARRQLAEPAEPSESGQR